MPSIAEEPLQRVPMSYDEWLALPEHPRTEWVDGVAVVSPNPNIRHQRIGRLLTNLLEAELAPLQAEVALNVRLPDNRVRIPDVVVLAEPADLFVETAPILVAEVLSPSTRREDTMRKAPEYAAAGIGQYWIVDPEARSIDVYQNSDGHWEQIAVVDERMPRATIRVDEHGSVDVDLVALLDG